MCALETDPVLDNFPYGKSVTEPRSDNRADSLRGNRRVNGDNNNSRSS